MKKVLITILIWIWCLPQQLAGLVVYLFIKSKQRTAYKTAHIINWESYAGLSLGQFIFVHKHCGDKTIMHEYGHTKQSYMLGWLYLIVIGLPSLIWCNCFEGYRRKHNISYYSFYTERWANKLGGVV